MILDAFPVPMTVRVGGREVEIRPLRMRDLATLDAFLRDRSPLRVGHPPDEWDDWSRRRAYAAQYKVARAWPPAWGSEAAKAVESTTEGRAWFLVVVAGLSPAQAVEIAAHATRDEWGDVEDAAYGRHPADWLVRLMDPDRPTSEPGGESVTLDEAIDALSQDRGWTYAQIGEMTLSQFRMARTGGKPRATKLVAMPGETLRDAAAKRRRLLADEDRGEDGTRDTTTTTEEPGDG